MTEEEARTAVRTTIAVMARLAQSTRTTVDNVLVEILRGNEARLTAAVLELANDPTQPPSPERISQALSTVGIHPATR